MNSFGHSVTYLAEPSDSDIARRIVFLAAVDTSPLAADVLLKVAELARRCDGEVVVLHVIQSEDGESIEQLRWQTEKFWQILVIGL